MRIAALISKENLLFQRSSAALEFFCLQFCWQNPKNTQQKLCRNIFVFGNNILLLIVGGIGEAVSKSWLFISKKIIRTPFTSTKCSVRIHSQISISSNSQNVRSQLKQITNQTVNLPSNLLNYYSGTLYIFFLIYKVNTMT